MTKRTDPIDNIEWVHVDELQSNAWNPNNVMRSELRLIERSILQQGWIQPILVSPEGYIIDGYHRWSMSRDSKALKRAYGGLVPVARLDVSEAEARIITVRINRAKGTHQAFLMSHLVRELIDDFGMPPQDVARELGATSEEVDRLYGENVFVHRDLANAPYSRAWVPEERERTPEDDK